MTEVKEGEESLQVVKQKRKKDKRKRLQRLTMFLVGIGDATGIGRFNGLLPTGRGEGDVVLVVEVVVG